MPSFEIPDGPATVALTDQTVKGKPVRTGTATFSVTNKTGQPLACHFGVQPQGDAKAEWFTIMGEAQRNFAASETQKIAVNLEVPQAATLGDYKFRFRAVNVNDPDNDYTESAVSTFTVAAAKAPDKKPFPWWIVIVGGVVLLLIVGGVVAWLVLGGGGGKVKVPDVSSQGLSLSDAEQKITDAGLHPVPSPADATSGKVTDQNPKADADADKGSDVTLTVSVPAQTVEVPDVSSQGYSFDTAAGFLSAKGFTASRHDVAAQGKPPGTVVAQMPAAHAMVPESTKDITLDVDPGVQVPDVSSGKNLSFQTAYNKLHGAGLNIGRQNCRFDSAHAGKVVDQNPAAGTALARGKDVDVDIGSAILCIHFIPFVTHRLQPIHP